MIMEFQIGKVQRVKSNSTSFSNAFMNYRGTEPLPGPPQLLYLEHKVVGKEDLELASTPQIFGDTIDTLPELV